MRWLFRGTVWGHFSKFYYLVVQLRLLESPQNCMTRFVELGVSQFCRLF